MDFNFFEDTINKNIETDKASDKFDRQLQAHKEAGVKLDAANNCIAVAKDSLNEATAAFKEVVDDTNAAVQHLFETLEKFYAFTFKAKLAENGGYPPTQNGDIRSLFWLFSLMALQN